MYGVALLWVEGMRKCFILGQKGRQPFETMVLVPPCRSGPMTDNAVQNA